MEMIGILSTGRLFRQRKGDAGREWEYIGGAGDCEAREGTRIIRVRRSQAHLF